MKCVTLFRQDDHCWQMFGQDPDKPDNVIDTNQYLIRSGDSAILLDPGGMETGKAAKEFGIIAPGTMFLVGKDGKVISNSASIEDLKKLLPVKVMLATERVLQAPLAPLYFGPSVFFLVRRNA